MELQARENDAVGGDANEEGRSGRGDVDDGAVVVLQEAELDGTSMKLAVGVLKAQNRYVLVCGSPSTYAGRGWSSRAVSLSWQTPSWRAERMRP